MRLILYVLAALLVAGCGGGGGGGGGSSTPATAAAPGPSLPLPSGDNVMAVVVDSGPQGRNVNRLYAKVTICAPGNASLCQTIDHVVVDTGSIGLRLLASEVRPELVQSLVNGPQGFPLANCVRFVDNTFGFGPVVSVDVRLGGKTAASLPIQLMGAPAFVAKDAVCPGGTRLDTVLGLGGKGVLGLGLFKQDCGAACVIQSSNNYYFSCTSSACTAIQPSLAPLTQQVANPISRFADDNNGLLLDLPPASDQGNTSLSGFVVFGVNTRANNQLSAAKWLNTTTNAFINTVISGKGLLRSFIDTGSNALFFDSATIPLCAGTGRMRFYCPSARVNLSATLIGNDLAELPVTFSVDNALSLFSDPERAVLPTLAGNLDDPLGLEFDWGLPFFYGRRVFFGIEGESSPVGIGPYYAF